MRYVFSELGQSLRRNLSMHIAVILTLFISLTLVGLGVLLNRQSDRITERYGSELQITVFLCRDGDDNPSCATEVTDAQRTQITGVIKASPEVADYRFESKQEAFDAVKKQLGSDVFEGPNPAITAADMPEAIWITLKDASQYEGIESAVAGLDGVAGIRDQREMLTPIMNTMSELRSGSLGTAAFLVGAALLLVANTIRLAAFARRREIGIMRLVGASRLYITLPFLMEAVVTAVVAFGLAAGALAATLHWWVHGRLAERVSFIPLVGTDDYMFALTVTGIIAPVLTLLPTLLVTRKSLNV
jgi:cell division transport system permease protein